MTTVSIARPVPNPVTRRHPKLELVGDNGARVTLPFAPLGSIDGLGDEWVQVARDGGRPPILVHRGPQLATLTLDCTFADTRDPQASQEGLIFAVTVLARQARRVTLSSYGVLVGNAWRITGLNAAPSRRQHGTNAITAAGVTIELTAASDAVVRVGSTTGGSKTSADSATTSARRTVTANAGDTLAELATRALGDPNRGGELLDANGLRDPRSITPGQVLTVPVP